MIAVLIVPVGIKDAMADVKSICAKEKNMRRRERQSSVRKRWTGTRTYIHGKQSANCVGRAD